MRNPHGMIDDSDRHDCTGDAGQIATPRLILFTRYPTPGLCKTRLLPVLDPERAADLHRRLTERTVARLRASHCPVSIAFTGGTEAEFASWLGTGLDFIEQVDGDLSARLLACLGQAPVIFFGADTPDLDHDHIAAAISGLMTHDVVIGPAEDGGYYLIGLRRPIPELFTTMPWSSDQVLPETLRRLATMGIAPQLLPMLADCDRPEDLQRWPHLAP